MSAIPRIDEFIYMNEQYYQVLNVVYTLDDKNKIYVIVLETNRKLDEEKIN